MATLLPTTSEAFLPNNVGFYNIFVYFVGFNGFSIISKENQRPGMTISHALLHKEKAFLGVQTSRFVKASWALMPYEPFSALHINKTQTIKSKLKSISVED